MLNRIKNFIQEEKLIGKNQIVKVAFSGGADSTFLLYTLHKIKDELHFEVKAHHVNHNIRGKEALRDENFCRDFCNNYNIELFVSNVDAPKFAKEKHLTLEEAARILRYNELKDTKYYYDIIATAHHLNDNVETIIHNLVRGASLSGLEGMNIKNGEIIRPLLNFRREDIENFLKENSIDYINDSSNDDIEYTRNYIRKEIIPKLASINDKALEHISQMANTVKDANYFIQNEVINLIKTYNIVDGNKINSLLFSKQNKIIQVEIIKNVVSNVNNKKNSLKDWTQKHYNDIIALSGKPNGSHLDLPYNITLDKKNNLLIFTKNDTNISMSRRKKK